MQELAREPVSVLLPQAASVLAELVPGEPAMAEQAVAAELLVVLALQAVLVWVVLVSELVIV